MQEQILYADVKNTMNAYRVQVIKYTNQNTVQVSFKTVSYFHQFGRCFQKKKNWQYNCEQAFIPRLCRLISNIGL